MIQIHGFTKYEESDTQVSRYRVEEKQISELTPIPHTHIKNFNYLGIKAQQNKTSKGFISQLQNLNIRVLGRVSPKLLLLPVHFYSFFRRSSLQSKASVEKELLRNNFVRNPSGLSLYMQINRNRTFDVCIVNVVAFQDIRVSKRRIKFRCKARQRSIGEPLHFEQKKKTGKFHFHRCSSASHWLIASCLHLCVA